MMVNIKKLHSKIEAKNVSIFVKEQPIIKDVSFTVPANQISTIIGANGAGKSTLLKAIIGDIPYQSGLINIDNQKIQAKQNLQDYARNVAFLNQFSVLNFPFTVNEVVKLGRIPHGTGEAIDNEISQQCLETVEMTDFSERFYPQLSGGEKQRVQIARVLAQIWRAEDCVNETQGSAQRMLILDEPSSSLDLGHQRMLMHFLKQFTQQEVTILLVLHNLNTAANYSDHLICLKQGELLLQGSPEKILQTHIIQQLFGIDCQIINNPSTGKPNLFEQ